MMATSPADEAKDDSSQWTRIGRKGKKLSRTRQQEQHHQPPTTHQPPAAGPAENFHPNPSPQLSANDICAAHVKITTKWQASEAHKKLVGIIQANAASHAAVTRAVCLGLGAFDPDDGSYVAQQRSHIQLAAFLSIVKEMGARYPTKKA